MRRYIFAYAPNLAGASYTAGNILLFVTGGLSGSVWQMAAAVLWTIDGLILGWFGRTVRGIEIHATINMLGTLSLMTASIYLEHPLGQLLFCWLMLASSSIKLLAPPSDQPMEKPRRKIALPYYYAMRYPLQAVAISAAISRLFAIYGAIANAQYMFLVCVMLWFLGDFFQFLSRKGGYTAVKSQ